MKKSTFLIILASAFFAGRLYASSPVFLRITKNLQEKAEIAILLSTGSDGGYWDSFMGTLSRDFDYSGYFSVEESKFVDDPARAKKAYSTQLVFLGEKTKEGLMVSVEDMLDEKRMFEKEYKKSGTPSALAHRICDDIVAHLTGKPGIASSRILFVSGPTGKYQLYRADYDGENVSRLTDAAHLVHYPRWLFPYEDILFVSYRGGWPRLVRKNLSSGEEKTVLAEPGLNACASPCRKTGEMAVVLSRTGRPEIYIADFNGNILKRVTYSNSTDASPSFSPCGKMIAFVSDRHGTAQVYTMTKDGYRIKRISYLSGYSTSPAWSPDGNYIAYVFLRGGDYGIALYEVSTGETKIIGESLGSEDLSWAPNSRHLVYSNMKSSPSSLMVLDVLTGEKRKLASNKLNAFSPGWGPY